MGDMKITEHFDSKEFDCKDKTPYPEEWIETRLRPLCAALEMIRARAGRPLKITSGYRTVTYNKKVGGALFSQHTQGRAVDIACTPKEVTKLYLIITDLIHKKIIPDGGIGVYRSWVHLDQGPRRRWNG